MQTEVFHIGFSIYPVLFIRPLLQMKGTASFLDEIVQVLFSK